LRFIARTDLPALTCSSATDCAELPFNAAEARRVLVVLMNSRLSNVGPYLRFDLEIKRR